MFGLSSRDVYTKILSFRKKINTMGQKLGQHFLKNKNIAREIAEALLPADGEVIIEIGPGHGELTEHLKSQISNLKNCKIILIERDAELAEQLKKKYGNEKNIEIVCGDALKVLPEIVSSLGPSAKGGSASGGSPHTLYPIYKIVGNIPYYITGYLLRTIQELKKKPARVVLMIQKEVAERIVKGAPEMSLLSASIQYWAKPKLVRIVSKKEFSPAPKIDSAVLLLDTTEITEKKRENEESYYETLKILFKQPRKTIKNNITLLCRTAEECYTQGEKEELFSALEKNGIPLEARPQNLSIHEIQTVAHLLYSK